MSEIYIRLNEVYWFSVICHIPSASKGKVNVFYYLVLSAESLSVPLKNGWIRLQIPGVRLQIPGERQKHVNQYPNQKEILMVG